VKLPIYFSNILYNSLFYSLLMLTICSIRADKSAFRSDLGSEKSCSEVGTWVCVCNSLSTRLSSNSITDGVYKSSPFVIATHWVQLMRVLLQQSHGGRSLVRVTLRSPRVGCHLEEGCWSWVRSQEHEILSQVLTSLASMRDVLLWRSLWTTHFLR
jgi:hypothetical protein